MDAKLRTTTDIHWSERLRPRVPASMTAANASVENQRWALRKRADISGYLTSERLTSAVKCVVRDTSSSGARIHLVATSERITVDDIPHEFTLVMTHSRETTEVTCTVVRRLGDSIGVSFVGSFKTTPKPVRRAPVAARKR